MIDHNAINAIIDQQNEGYYFVSIFDNERNYDEKVKIFGYGPAHAYIERRTADIEAEVRSGTAFR